MLRLALDGLPERQQSAIRMAMVERLAVPGIAARLGISSVEVMDAMRDGLTTLRDVFAVVDPDTAAIVQASGPGSTHA
jgi:DNA-directed RNA polymerase specialized sigma24 family protein